MDSTLKALVDTRYRTVQKTRIGFHNRIVAIEDGRDKADPMTVDMLHKWESRFQEMEDELEQDIISIADDYPIIEHMIAVKGVSFLLAARVICHIDISRATTVSALWRYSGYGVTNGERDRPTKGQPLNYNKTLKTSVYNVGSSFLKAGGPYRAEYDAAREYYWANRPDWTKGHNHLASMRKMVKLWLSHLWDRWRRIEGLPTSEPYAHAKLAHEHIKTPAEYGWNPIEEYDLAA